MKRYYSSFCGSKNYRTNTEEKEEKIFSQSFCDRFSNSPESNSFDDGTK
jgi:hypothetical protein